MRLYRKSLGVALRNDRRFFSCMRHGSMRILVVRGTSTYRGLPFSMRFVLMHSSIGSVDYTLAMPQKTYADIAGFWPTC